MSLIVRVRPEESIVIGGGLEIKVKKSSGGVRFSIVALRLFSFCEGGAIDVEVKEVGDDTVLLGIDKSPALSIAQKFRS